MADMLEQVADAIDAARYAHPTHPRERPRPFSEADAGDREYATRMARTALRVRLPDQPAEHVIDAINEAIENYQTNPEADALCFEVYYAMRRALLASETSGER